MSHVIMASCMSQSDKQSLSPETIRSCDKNANKLTIFLIISSDGERQLQTLQQRTTFGCPLRDSLWNTLENQFDSYDIIEPGDLTWDASAETLKGQTLKLHRRKIPYVGGHLIGNSHTHGSIRRANLGGTCQTANANDNETQMSNSMNISLSNESTIEDIESHSQQQHHHRFHHQQKANCVQFNQIPSSLLNNNRTDNIPVTEGISSLMRNHGSHVSHISSNSRAGTVDHDFNCGKSGIRAQTLRSMLQGGVQESSGIVCGEGFGVEDKQHVINHRGHMVKPSHTELNSRSSVPETNGSSDVLVKHPIITPCSDTANEPRNNPANRYLSNSNLALEATVEQLNHTPTPGWLGRVSQKHLTTMISPYLHKDGHYVIWVPNDCEELVGKLVMTVTHQGNLLHYNLRTRLMANQPQYYIFKEVFHTPDLRELVQFYSNHELHGSTDDKTKYMPTKHPQLRTPLCFDFSVL